MALDRSAFNAVLNQAVTDLAENRDQLRSILEALNGAPTLSFNLRMILNSANPDLDLIIMMGHVFYAGTLYQQQLEAELIVRRTPINRVN